MAKNEEYRRQRKAADRRRARRPQPAPQADAAAGKGPSPARRLDDALLSEVVRIDQAVPGLTDPDLRAALQSALRGGRPAGGAAVAICEALERVRQTQQPSPRLWRDALNQMLRMASGYERQDTRGRNYLQFLQSLAP